MSTHRNQRIDLIKGFAIITVVIGHAIQTCYSENNLDYNLNIMFRLIYSFHMPLFVFLSSYTMGKYNTVFDIQWLKKRFMGLVIPFWSWAVVLWLLREATVHEKTLFERLIILVKDPANMGLWFLLTIFYNCLFLCMAWYISYFICKKIISINHQLALFGVYFVILAIIICILKLTSIQNGRISVDYLLYFALGLVKARKKRSNEIKQGIRIMLLFFGLAIFSLLFAYRNYIVEYFNGAIHIDVNGILAFMLALDMISVVFVSSYLIRWKENSCIYRALILLGRNTLPIYGMHYLFLAITLGSTVESIIIRIVTAIVMPLVITQYVISKNHIAKILLLGGR